MNEGYLKQSAGLCNTSSSAVCGEEAILSVMQRLNLVQQRARAVRNASMNILSGALQQPSVDEKERAGHSGVEGQLRDVQEALEDAERALQALGIYLFA